MKTHILGGLSYAIVVLAFACTVTAQQTASVAVSPASLDTAVRPGSSYTQVFTLTNTTNERLKFAATVDDVWFDENNKRLNGLPGTLPHSASKWVQFTPSEVIVEAHSTGTIKVTITIPQNATGSFYTVPVFESAPVRSSAIINAVAKGDVTASIGIRFRGLIMLTTETGSEYNVELMGANITPPTASSEMALDLDLRNRGNAHARVRGAFAILDANGKLAGRGNIDEKRVMPTQRLIVKSKWAGTLKPGNYTCIVTLTYNRAGSIPSSLTQEIAFQVK